MDRWDVWDEMRRMQQEMENLFRSFWGRDYFSRSPLIEGPRNRDLMPVNYREPIADIWETDKEIVATVELPGVNKEDIQVNVRDNGVEVKVERQEEKKDEKKDVYRIERSYTGFYRYFSLPEYVDTSKIEATYKNGVLELRIPKKESATDKSRRVQVK